MAFCYTQSMPKIPGNPLKFGLIAFKTHKKWAIIAVCAVTGAMLMQNLLAVVLRNLTDAVVGDNINFSEVWKWVFTYIALYVAQSATWRTSGFSGMRWFTYSYAYQHQVLYDYLAKHSRDYFNSRFAGSLANKITNAADGVEQIYTKTLWHFIPLVVAIVVYTVITWTSSPILSVIFLTWTLTFLLINYALAQKLHPISRSTADSHSTMKGKVIDSLSNMSVVHEFANARFESEYVGQYIETLRRKGLKEWTMSEWILVINGVMIFVFSGLMLIGAVYLFQTGVISAGTIIMTIAIVQNISHQLFFIGQEMKEVAKGYGKAKEGLEEVLIDHDIVDKEGANDVHISQGNVLFDHVGFSYDTTRVFDDFTLEIKHGQKVGLVGRSGAGKSTFVSLLLRHYEPQNGAIKIENHDISEITLESLRRSVALVPQDTSLFHRTIKENISFSKPDATEEEVMHASKLALADEFIQHLPETYDTLVGERGVKLSGGQRQRIAIARAFLKDAPILVLDEATSSLDSESEEAIQQSLEGLMENRTVIAIAHRLSTLRKMDRIIVLEDGKIIEDGSPNDLLQRESGIFKNLWDHQVSGFIVEE